MQGSYVHRDQLFQHQRQQLSLAHVYSPLECIAYQYRWQLTHQSAVSSAPLLIQARSLSYAAVSLLLERESSISNRQVDRRLSQPPLFGNHSLFNGHRLGRSNLISPIFPFRSPAYANSPGLQCLGNTKTLKRLRSPAYRGQYSRPINQHCLSYLSMLCCNSAINGIKRFTHSSCHRTLSADLQLNIDVNSRGVRINFE